MKTKISVGVLGIQGDVEENKTVAEEALNHTNTKGDVKVVRYAEEIEKIDGLILPGGESPVITTLAEFRAQYYIQSEGVSMRVCRSLEHVLA